MGPLCVCAQGCPIRAHFARANRRLFLPHFCQGFAAVARVTQRLQVAAIRESRPRALVRLDMVDVCGADAHAVLCTLAAVRLAQELAGAEIIPPLGRQVHPVPGCTIGAALRPRLVY